MESKRRNLGHAGVRTRMRTQSVLNFLSALSAQGEKPLQMVMQDLHAVAAAEGSGLSEVLCLVLVPC